MFFLLQVYSYIVAVIVASIIGRGTMTGGHRKHPKF